MKIYFKSIAATLAASSFCAPYIVMAQETDSGPIQAVAVAKPIASGRMATLPANTELIVRMNEELTTKKNEEGETFFLTVVHDVLLDGFVIVPKGARAIGEITWRTGKGAFGKSGKMDIEVKHVEVGGKRIPVIGKFRQEGEGNTVATVAAVALVWVAAPFITGKSGRIPAGRELTVHTRDDMAVALPETQTPKVEPVASPETVLTAAPAA
jgi:hypothetical protein